MGCILYIIGYEEKIIGWIQSSHCNCIVQVVPEKLCKKSLIFLIMAHNYYIYLKGNWQLYCKLSTSNKLVIKTGIQNPLDMHLKEK